MNILWGLTGSVASQLAPKIKEKIEKDSNLFRFILTDKSRMFLDTRELWPFFNTDEDEIRLYDKKRVLHIELTKFYDKFIIAPCSANTIAKLANGISDNLLTCCARAWDLKNKPFIIAPAMNCQMWDHPITQKHLETLKSWGIVIKDPISKVLFCGDEGIGAMANIEDILS